MSDDPTYVSQPLDSARPYWRTIASDQDRIWSVGIRHGTRPLKGQSTRPDLLWADAICVDQQNVLERDHQVSLMKEKYSKASRVLVWQGDSQPDEEEIAVALMAIRSVAALSYTERWDLSFSDLDQAICNRGYANTRLVLAAALLSQCSKRVWCVQEIALASAVLLLFGQHELDGADMIKFTACVERHKDSRQRLLTSRLLGSRFRQYARDLSEVLWSASTNIAADGTGVTQIPAVQGSQR